MKKKRIAAAIGGVLILAAASTIPVMVTREGEVSLVLNSQPFIFVAQRDAELPEGLTNIGPEGLDIVELVWGVRDLNGDGIKEWVSHDPHTGAGNLQELVDGEPYVVTHFQLLAEWVIYGGYDWMVPIAVTDLDWNSDGLVDSYDRNVMESKLGSVLGDLEYERSLDPNWDGVIDQLDLDILGATRENAPSLMDIRALNGEQEKVWLEWPDGEFSCWLVSSTEEAIEKFTGGKGKAGWISIERHPAGASCGGYDCQCYATDSLMSAYKALGYGRLLNGFNQRHEFNVFWTGGNWTDLNNWLISEPNNGDIKPAIWTEGSWMVWAIKFPYEVLENGYLKCFRLFVDSEKQLVSYGDDYDYFHRHIMEEPWPSTFNVSLGVE